MVLYNGRTMGTYDGDVSNNYRYEIIDSPKVAKTYNAQFYNLSEITVDNTVIDCAMTILDSKNGKLADEDILFL